MNWMLYQNSDPLILILCAFACGLIGQLVSKKICGCSRNMELTLLILPAVVCAALVTVNGNMGAGLATLGVFSLVRFRSVPGNPSDIAAVFFAMTIGLVCSTGYLVSAALITLTIGLVFILGYYWTMARGKTIYLIRVSMPENLGSINEVERILSSKGKSELIQSRTSHMGTLFDLSYTLETSDLNQTELVDELRKFNQNLPVSILKNWRAEEV